MGRPLIFLHGYSDKGQSFFNLSKELSDKGIDLVDINIATYVTLNNEVTIKDIAEGLERAFEFSGKKLPADPNFEFDAIVHSTGMLVLRSWLTNHGVKASQNPRLKRLKHLIGLAPATWGSPQAHKGRSWVGALVKGNKDILGPDFLNAGDMVLDGLELGSAFTWDLAHRDLLGDEPYYDKGDGTPFVAVFIGNQPYTGLDSVANDPGTDGTVRWAGCSLNTRKIRIDMTKHPMDMAGNIVNPDANGIVQRVWLSDFADQRLDIPMIAVPARDHGTLIHDPEPGMVDLMMSFLKIGEPDKPGEPPNPTYDQWLVGAKEYRHKALPEMLKDPDPNFFGRLFHKFDTPLEGWQQFVVHAIDERGDPVKDYMVSILDENLQSIPGMHTDVHAYGADPSYRNFHIQLPAGLSSIAQKLSVKFNASTGTELVAYQGYSAKAHELTASSDPIILSLDFGGNGSLFYPFTTTLIEIVLNRAPLPFDGIAPILTWIVPPPPTEPPPETDIS